MDYLAERANELFDELYDKLDDFFITAVFDLDDISPLGEGRAIVCTPERLEALLNQHCETYEAEAKLIAKFVGSVDSPWYYRN